MNKLEIVKALQDETGISKLEAQAVVELFFGSMIDALSKEEQKLFNFYVPERVYTE